MALQRQGEGREHKLFAGLTLPQESGELWRDPILKPCSSAGKQRQGMKQMHNQNGAELQTLLTTFQAEFLLFTLPEVPLSTYNTRPFSSLLYLVVGSATKNI